MGLFKPAWMSRNWDKAVAAVENLTDQNELRRVAKEAPADGARITAVKKINDQSFIEEIAKHDTEWLVRRAAVGFLTDKTVLDSIREKDREREVRSAAYERLTELYKIEAEKQAKLRIAEIKRMTDQDQLADIAIKDERVYKPFGYYGEKSWFAFYGCLAVESLTDQGLLADVVKNAREEDVRIAAVEKITDQEILKELLARRYEDFQMCRSAVNKVTDQSVLAGIANDNNQYFEIRVLAIERSTDKTVLGRIASSLTEVPLKFYTSVPAIDDFKSLCKHATQRLESLRYEETCRGKHDWKLAKSYHTTSSGGDCTYRYFYEDYICKRCGKTKTVDCGSQRD